MVLVHLHYYAAFVLVVLGLYLLGWGPRRTVINLGLAALAVTVAFSPWLPVFYRSVQYGVSRSGETWWQQLALLPLFSAVGRTLVWKAAGAKVVAGVDLLVVALLFLPAAWLLLGRRTEERDGMRIGPAVALGLGLPVFVGLFSLATPMVHTHYLTCVIPPLLVLIALAVAEGVRAPFLGRPGRTADRVGADRPGVAGTALFGPAQGGLAVRDAARRRDGAGLPVYFYEDIGETPYGYYLPHQPRHTLIKPFGEDGKPWEKAGYFTQFRREPEGFWFVFYGTSSTVLAEQTRVLAELKRRFDVLSDEDFGRMRLLRCRPVDGVAARSIDR